MRSVLGCMVLLGLLCTEAAAEGVHHLLRSPTLRYQSANWSNPRIVELGQRLFFDPGLSGSGHTACASCHDPDVAYADPRPVSISDNGRPGRRNAPSILNTAFRPRLTWDGRFGSLEEQAFDPFKRDGEMGIGIEDAAGRISLDPSYAQQFFATFGRPPSPDGIVSALAAFERTLVNADSRFDRFVLYRDRSALSPVERQGFEIFTSRAGCVNCHSIFAPTVRSLPLLSDFGFHNIGIGFGNGGFLDPGRAGITSASSDCGVFRTPSLRNVAVTGPYMHNGSLRTLYDVVSFYNAGGQPNPNHSPILRPLGLTEYEKNALIAFLISLTDQDYE